MQRKEYPLLEYDPEQEAVFSPADFDIPQVVPEKKRKNIDEVVKWGKF